MCMNLTIVIIGDEILLGNVTDTNSGEIARTFHPEGWQINCVTTVGDNRDEIKSAIEDALEHADLVITTGGLGPTKDDITKGVLLEIFGGELVFNPEVAENIRDVFNRRGLALNPLTEAQAIVPTTCRVIQNRFGTAPVMMFERGEKALVAMPGVPFETKEMLPEVLRIIGGKYGNAESVLHHTIIVSGITESDLAQKLAEYEENLPESIHLAYLPTPGYIRLRVDGKNVNEATFSQSVSGLKSLLRDILIYDGDATPAEILLKILEIKELTCATAESCTGGNIARNITAVPGSSRSYLGGVVSYANSVKTGLLDVGKETLQRYGAVSREVVEQMALGACRATGADCAVATSGIAGPGGGTPDKPVGTVWIAWAVSGKAVSKIFHFPGDRLRVIERATNEGIINLIKILKDIQHL